MVLTILNIQEISQESERTFLGGDPAVATVAGREPAYGGYRQVLEAAEFKI